MTTLDQMKIPWPECESIGKQGRSSFLQHNGIAKSTSDSIVLPPFCLAQLRLGDQKELLGMGRFNQSNKKNKTDWHPVWATNLSLQWASWYPSRNATAVAFEEVQSKRHLTAVPWSETLSRTREQPSIFLGNWIYTSEMYIIIYNYYKNTNQIQPGKFNMKIPALYHVPKPRGSRGFSCPTSELPHRVDTVAFATAHQLFGFPGRSKKKCGDAHYRPVPKHK